MSLMQHTQALANQDVAEIYQTRYIGFVSFTILVWDHIVTFPEEVEYIWKGSKGPLIYLFFINRYVIPLGFIVNLVAYNLEYWPDETCERYVRYEGAMTNLGVEIVGLMMLIRVHALYYDKSRLVVAFVAFILLAETGTNVYLLMYAGPVLHYIYQTQVHSCSMIYHSGPAGSAASAWIPLLYDTIVLLLTLYITVPSIRRDGRGHIVRTIFTDGLLYYGVICTVTLVLTIMIAAAPPGVKNITAQLELLLTVTMMSRITIHLKEEFHAPSFAGHRYAEEAVYLSFSRDQPSPDVRGHKRSGSYSSSYTSYSDLGISPTKPAPAHFLSTIRSEQDSGIQTPVRGHDTVPVSADIGEMVYARVGDQMGRHGTAHIWIDEESR